jgi:hypothetical protein
MTDTACDTFRHYNTPRTRINRPAVTDILIRLSLLFEIADILASASGPRQRDGRVIRSAWLMNNRRNNHKIFIFGCQPEFTCYNFLNIAAQHTVKHKQLILFILIIILQYYDERKYALHAIFKP